MVYRSSPSFRNMCSIFPARSKNFIRQFPSYKGYSSIDKLLQLHRLVPTKQQGSFVFLLFFVNLYCMHFLLLIACNHPEYNQVS